MLHRTVKSAGCIHFLSVSKTHSSPLKCNTETQFIDCVCPDVSPQFARPQSLIGYGSRCDKLDQAETRSLLMCFLHIMKTISEGKMRTFKS